MRIVLRVISALLFAFAVMGAVACAFMSDGLGSLKGVIFWSSICVILTIAHFAGEVLRVLAEHEDRRSVDFQGLVRLLSDRLPVRRSRQWQDDVRPVLVAKAEPQREPPPLQNGPPQVESTPGRRPGESLEAWAVRMAEAEQAAFRAKRKP